MNWKMSRPERDLFSQRIYNGTNDIMYVVVVQFPICRPSDFTVSEDAAIESRNHCNSADLLYSETVALIEELIPQHIHGKLLHKYPTFARFHQLIFIRSQTMIILNYFLCQPAFTLPSSPPPVVGAI